ncbi:MAG: hypothetical protein F6K00_23570 [Leptolyngbya sp. SIOISBB]|nr:hypothetical protein [Leptolyngbya sp. SIOISBB]
MLSRLTVRGPGAPRRANRRLVATILTASCLSIGNLSGTARATAQGAIAVTPQSGATTGAILPIPRERFADLWRGILRGKDAFWAEVQKGGFVALTGVEPRRPIWLLEGATYTINPDNSITFVLANGVVVPPLSRETYEVIRSTVPPGQQYVLDDKFFWHLQRNPAIPLIAAGLSRGEYEELISNKVFDTDEYYLRPFLGHLFWAAQKADVPLQELLPLVETHLTTLEFPYLREQDLQTESGSVHSFYKYEQALTNKQYLLRSLLTTPIEPWLRLEAIAQVEAASTKEDYTDAESTSTTIALGRLPLPTPTAAEDTPAVHALNIAHVAQQGIALFPEDLVQASLNYRHRYEHRRALEAALRQQLDTLATDHGDDILTAINHYYDRRFWQDIGLTHDLSRRSVNQMDTSRILGLFATRTEAITNWPAADSYPVARRHFITFFQNNAPDLSDSELLTLLFCDQAFNPRFWRSLKRWQPNLVTEITAIQAAVGQLEQSYTDASAQEAEVFRLLQTHQLDISTESFSLLSVAMAKRLSDLVYAEFQPSDRKAIDYLEFTRALYPFLRDMPDLNKQWGNGQNIKRYGLDNYVVPNLMALTPEEAPTLEAMGDLWFKMVSNGDLARWDRDTFMQLVSTANSLSSNQSPTRLPPKQLALLPLVDKYRPELKRVAGADGNAAPAVLHGLNNLDFRLAGWPSDRATTPPRVTRLSDANLQQIFPQLSPEGITNLNWRLANHSGEFSVSLPLVMLQDPLFVQQADGAIDLLFAQEGQHMVLPKFNHHFDSIYSPAYMTRIAVPRQADAATVKALNQVLLTTHAMYGGYTPPYMTLPAPLQPMWGE